MILPYLHRRTGLPDIAPETHLRELPRYRFNHIDHEALKRMYVEERLSTVQIGHAFGVSSTSVRKWLTKLAVPKNTGSRAKSLAARFAESYTIDANGCWICSKGPGQYSRFKLPDHTSVGGHRLSYELHHGPIPAGMLVCHRCDVPRCVNPDHLFLGTAGDNNQDRQNKQRQARGSKSAGAVLTEAQVAEIWAMRASGKLIREIMAHFGVSRSCIDHILYKGAWAHVPPPADVLASMERRQAETLQPKAA